MNAVAASPGHSPARHRAMALALCAVVYAQAGAAPVEGTLKLNGAPIVVAHVLAKLHDNAEGVVRRPLLIAVADRPIPPGALDGMGETVAAQLAAAGKLRGLLFRIDPARPDEASVIVLDKPVPADRSLTSLVVGTKEQPAVTRLQIGAERVSVAFVRPAGGAQAVDLGFALEVAAPLTREPPITADLRGPAVRASTAYAAARAYAEAMHTGDVAGQARLSSRSMNERMSKVVDPPAMTARIAREEPSS
jgi:hypothetical protein